MTAAVVQEDEVSLLQPETVRRLCQWIRRVTEHGATAMGLPRCKLSDSVLSQTSSEKIRKVSVALNVYHSQGSTSAWLQNLVKGSGHESSYIDEEIDMAFSQEVLYEIVDPLCINPEG